MLLLNVPLPSSEGVSLAACVQPTRGAHLDDLVYIHEHACYLHTASFRRMTHNVRNTQNSCKSHKPGRATTSTHTHNTHTHIHTHARTHTHTYTHMMHIKSDSTFHGYGTHTCTQLHTHTHARTRTKTYTNQKPVEHSAVVALLSGCSPISLFILLLSIRFAHIGISSPVPTGTAILEPESPPNSRCAHTGIACSLLCSV